MRCLALLTIVQEFRTAPTLPSSHFPRRRAHWICFIFSTHRIWILKLFANFSLVVGHFGTLQCTCALGSSSSRLPSISLCHEHNTQHSAQSSSWNFWDSFWPQWVRCLSLLMDIIIIMLDPYQSGTCGTLWLVHKLATTWKKALFFMQWNEQVDVETRRLFQRQGYPQSLRKAYL